MKIKKTNPIPAILTVSVIILGYLSYKLLTQKPSEPAIYQVTGGTGTVILTLTPASSTIAANTTTDLDLKIDTGTGKVSAVQVELAYLSGRCVTPISVTKGDFLSVVLAAPTVTSNKIKFTYAVPPASGGKQGTGTLAKITTGPTTGSCVLSFTSNTLAAAIGSGINALASASDAAINLTGAPASPNPSPSSQPGPSVSPVPNQLIKKIYERFGEKGAAVICNRYGICDE